MPASRLTRQEAQAALNLYAECGNNAAAAAGKAGVPRQTMQHRIETARRYGLTPGVDPATHEAEDARQGYAPAHDMTHTVPDGYFVKGVSTLYTGNGEVAAQWVKSSADQLRQEQIIREGLAAMAETLPRLKPVAAPKHVSRHLMACYPVGDHHLGMLSWEPETGADYDITIAETLLAGALDHLVKSVPPCGHAVIAVLGDFLHYDGFDSVTPTSRNQLDSDSRFPKMVRAAIRSLRRMIDTAVLHHLNVRVIVEIGNHDIASSVFLMEALSNIYDKEPRVTVDTSPKHFHYFRFGQCLVGTHHGHGAKMDKLPLVMATDRAEDWGATSYRYWWTGHGHHDAVKEYEGCRVESFRVLAPRDAWAANKGYRAGRDMKAIVLHKDFGEVARHIVNPSMLAEGAMDKEGNGGAVLEYDDPDDEEERAASRRRKPDAKVRKARRPRHD